jgi:hypothetical protein
MSSISIAHDANPVGARLAREEVLKDNAFLDPEMQKAPSPGQGFSFIASA